MCKNGPIGPAHTALSVREFSNQTNNCVGTPCLFTRSSHNDFLLFPKIKKILKDRHFDDIDGIRLLQGSPEGHSTNPFPNHCHFQNCFEGCISRWQLCIVFQLE